jgi:segregation and condensation protein B
MSLKAKIEAVIYAAEEPVTLEQLAAIFASEFPATPREAPGDASLDPSYLDQAGVDSLLEEGIIEGGNFMAASEDHTVEIALLTAREQRRKPAASALDSAAAEVEAKKAARQRDREIRARIKPIVDELIADYANGDRGMEIREVAGGYRIGTKPAYHDAVRAFVKSLKPPMKLSLQALETLAVIAYKQPVTAPEVGEIRGVDSSGVIGGLISRKLITTAGRKQVIGRPILYKTTREFLLRFGLKDLNELPSIEEFEKLAGDIEIGEEEPPENAAEAASLPFEADAGDEPLAESGIEEIPAAATEEGAPSYPAPSLGVGGAEVPVEASSTAENPGEGSQLVEEHHG